jgi:hypothetical protein
LDLKLLLRAHEVAKCFDHAISYREVCWFRILAVLNFVDPVRIQTGTIPAASCRVK